MPSLRTLFQLIFVQLESKLIKPIKCIERQISKNLQEADIKTRYLR